MTPTPLIAGAQETVIGSAIGIAVASVAQYVLMWCNLRWTWALFPAGLGALLLAAGLYDSWNVALVVGGLITARWTFLLERRDRESGGDARRRAREAVGPVDALAKRRSLRLVGRGNVCGQGEFLLGYGARSRPVSLRLGGESGRHGLLLGASGSGKSNALTWGLARHIEAGYGAVVIDMKGDQVLAKRLEREAEASCVDFYRWTLDGGDRWNPLARGNRSELKDKLIATEQFSERHYQAMYERYLLNLFRALENRQDERNLRTVVRLLDPAELAMFVRDLAVATVAEEIGTYLSRLTGEQGRDLRGLADRLALLIEGGHGELLVPTEGDREIDVLSVLDEGAVALFSLNSSSYGATAKLVGNMVVQDLKAACGAIEAGHGLGRPAVVAVDEFSGLDGDQIAGLFQRARSAALSVILATQELADLRRVDEGFDEQIVGNVEWLLAGRQNNPSSAELVAGIAGTEEVWVHTFQTEEGLGRPTSRFVRESGIGTKHRGREFYVPPDEIKRLPVGRMLLVEKNPHRVEIVNVMSADSAADRSERRAA